MDTENSQAGTKDNRRLDILRAALPLFTIQGYDTVKIDDITKACGCSHGLFYHYFPSKLCCFNTMIDEAFASGKMKLPKEALMRGNSALESMSFLADRLLYLLKDDEENCCYFYIFLTNPFQKTLPLPKKDGSKKHFPDLLMEVIQKGQKEGTFLLGNPEEMMHLFLSFLKGIIYERLHSDTISFYCPSKKLILRMLIKEDALEEIN